MPKTNKIRVLITDAQPIFRSGLRHLLSRRPGILVVGEAGDSKETCKLVSEEKPTILLLDSLMLEMNGLKNWSELTEKHKDVKIIVLTSDDGQERGEAILSVRPAAILSKQ